MGSGLCLCLVVQEARGQVVLGQCLQPQPDFGNGTLFINNSVADLLLSDLLFKVWLVGLDDSSVSLFATE